MTLTMMACASKYYRASCQPCEEQIRTEAPLSGEEILRYNLVLMKCCATFDEIFVQRFVQRSIKLWLVEIHRLDKVA